MEKVKVDIHSKFEQLTKTVQDKNGKDVVIFNRIPYDQKEAFVQELVVGTMGTDEEQGICYVLMNWELYFNYLFVKYYTNIDTEDFDTIEDFENLYDYCQQSGITYRKFYRDLNEDFSVVLDMEAKYRDSIVKLYETERSLGHKVKQMLDTNPDVNNEETRELLEKLVDMKGALIEKEEHDKLISFGKKKPANIKTGALPVNQAKR